MSSEQSSSANTCDKIVLTMRAYDVALEQLHNKIKTQRDLVATYHNRVAQVRNILDSRNGVPPEQVQDLLKEVETLDVALAKNMICFCSSLSG